MKFKFGDFVTIPYNAMNLRDLVESPDNVPAERTTIGIIVSIVQLRQYEILLAIDKNIDCGWPSYMYEIYCNENLSGAIRNQFNFWFTTCDYLKLINKQYEI